MSQQVKGYNDQKNANAGAGNNTGGGYGNIALNRAVKSKKTDQMNASLESFLKTPEPKSEPTPFTASLESDAQRATFDDFMSKEQAVQAVSIVEEKPRSLQREEPSVSQSFKQEDGRYSEIIHSQNDRIQYLEGKIEELVGMLETGICVSHSWIKLKSYQM